jgi:hypothetical protein
MRSSIKTVLAAAAAVACLLAAGDAYAIGEFSLGLNLGMTYDPNSLRYDLDRLNTAMEAYGENNPGTKVDQLAAPYAPVYGMNVRYQFNYFLFRIGFFFSHPLTKVEGGITPPGGSENTIRISTYQASIPATIGLLLPLKKRTFFYLGFGGTLHYAYAKMSQSNPVQAGPAFSMANLDARYTDISANPSDRWEKEFVGIHVILGAEVPVSSTLTISVEWMHQEGNSWSIRNSRSPTDTPRKSLSTRGNVLLFGVNYYISM